MKKHKKGRFVILFDGPSVGPDGTRLQLMADDDNYATVFPTAEKARRSLSGRAVAPFALWILDVDTGDAVNP